jgi:hypothetical protein
MVKRKSHRLTRHASRLYSVQRGLFELEQTRQEKWLDSMGIVGATIREWRDNVIADLGGPETVSTAERTIIDACARSYLLLHSVDRYLLSLPTPVDQRRRAVVNALVQREQIVGHSRVF